MDTTSIADFIHVVEPLQAIGPELDFHQDHATSGADFTLMVGGAGPNLNFQKDHHPNTPPPTKTPTVHQHHKAYHKTTTLNHPLVPNRYTRKQTTRKPQTIPIKHNVQDP